MKYAAVILILGLISPTVSADAEGDIAYRKAVMSVVKGHMGGLSTILRKRVHSEDLKYHANGMANISAIVPNVFPEGSGEGKTKALPEIWEKNDDFKEAMDVYLSAAREIQIAVNAGDQSQIGGAMKKLGGACKGCHDDFKAE